MLAEQRFEVILAELSGSRAASVVVPRSTAAPSREKAGATAAAAFPPVSWISLEACS